MKPYIARYYQYNVRKFLELVDRSDLLRISISDDQLESLNYLASLDESRLHYVIKGIYPTVIWQIVMCWVNRFLFGLAVLTGRIN